MAPYSGSLRKTGPRQITITVSEMSNVEIILDNIDLNVADETQARPISSSCSSYNTNNNTKNNINNNNNNYIYIAPSIEIQSIQKRLKYRL